MKNINLLLLLTLLVFAAGCKKDDDNTEKDNKNVPKLKTELKRGGTQYNYEYDSEGRLYKRKWSSFEEIYNYTTDSVLIESYSSGQAGRYIVYKLNSQGRATSSYVFNGSSIGDVRDNYTYDSNGYMTYDGAYYYTWTNSNLTFTTEGSIAYYYDNTTVNTIGNYNRGIFYLGKDSKYVPSSSTNPAHTYNYAVDTDKRIINKVDEDGQLGAFTYY